VARKINQTICAHDPDTVPPLADQRNHNERILRKILYDAYDGFADKRIKDLDKGSTFIVDDRDDSDIGANGKLLSYFCMMFVEVMSNESVTVTLYGNIPVGKNVELWLAQNDCKIETPDQQSRLSIDIEQGNQSILDELAKAIDSIVAPGAPRYTVKSYKYVCPRTTKSLRRLKDTLDEAWVHPLPPSQKSLFD